MNRDAIATHKGVVHLVLIIVDAPDLIGRLTVVFLGGLVGAIRGLRSGRWQRLRNFKHLVGLTITVGIGVDVSDSIPSGTRGGAGVGTIIGGPDR